MSWFSNNDSERGPGGFNFPSQSSGWPIGYGGMNQATPSDHITFESGEQYPAGMFRKGSLPGTHTGEVARHKFPCQFASVFAEKASQPGPKYSEDTVRNIRDVLHSRDNSYYYGESTANAADTVAEHAFLRGDPLSPRQAEHIQMGAKYLASVKDDLPQGFMNEAKKYYGAAKDEDGNKVVDTRIFNMGRGS